MARCTNGAATARSRLVRVRSTATSIVSLVTIVVVSLGRRSPHRRRRSRRAATSSRSAGE